MARPSWPEYFMEMVDVVRKRSTCLRRSVGAVAVRDKHMLCTGYNGAPKGIKHCLDTGCPRENINIPSGMRHELCRGLHAEQNVIIQAAFHGISLAGATLYCTTQPCIICAKMIINAGFKEVIYEEFYDDTMTLDMFKEARIKLGLWCRKSKKIKWLKKKKRRRAKRLRNEGKKVK